MAELTAELDRPGQDDGHQLPVVRAPVLARHDTSRTEPGTIGCRLLTLGSVLQPSKKQYALRYWTKADQHWPNIGPEG